MNYPSQNWVNNLLPLVAPLSHNGFIKFFERDMSLNSKKSMRSDLLNFLNWYQVQNNESFAFDRLTSQEVTEYRNFCQSRGQKPSTINRKLVSLRSLLKVAIEGGLITKNPCTGTKTLECQALSPKSLSEQEKRRLRKEVELRGSLRDRLIFTMLLEGGFRASELTSMTCEDLEVKDRSGSAVVRHGKMNKRRVVPLNQTVRLILAEYLKSRNKGPLLEGQRGTLKQPISINKIIEKYANLAQVHCSPHTLRHTFAYTYLSHNPSDIVGLAQILGHSSIQTTALYTGNRLEDLQRKVEAIC